jgi:hypothetical protein
MPFLRHGISSGCTKPHTHPELKQYQIDDVLEELKRQGILE